MSFLAFAGILITLFMAKRARKLIGKGLQYVVYEKNKCRVLKIPTTRRQKISMLKSWGVDAAGQKKKALEAERLTRQSVKGLKKIIGRIDPGLVGNPVFFGLSYEQDKIVSLGDYIARHSFKKNKKIVAAYVKSVIATWRYGFSDTVFNFTINNGIAKDGRVILTDLGELTFSKATMKRLVRKKSWLDHWSYRNLGDEKLKDYFKKVMDAKINATTFKKNWNKAARRGVSIDK